MAQFAKAGARTTAIRTEKIMARLFASRRQRYSILPILMTVLSLELTLACKNSKNFQGENDAPIEEEISSQPIPVSGVNLLFCVKSLEDESNTLRVSCRSRDESIQKLSDDIEFDTFVTGS